MRRWWETEPRKVVRNQVSKRQLEIQALQICPPLCHSDCLSLHRKSSYKQCPLILEQLAVVSSLRHPQLNWPSQCEVHTLFSFWRSVLFAGGGATHDPEHDDKLGTRPPEAGARTEGKVPRIPRARSYAGSPSGSGEHLSSFCH